MQYEKRLRIFFLMKLNFQFPSATLLRLFLKIKYLSQFKIFHYLKCWPRCLAHDENASRVNESTIPTQDDHYKVAKENPKTA